MTGVSRTSSRARPASPTWTTWPCWQDSTARTPWRPWPGFCRRPARTSWGFEHPDWEWFKYLSLCGGPALERKDGQGPGPDEQHHQGYWLHLHDPDPDQVAGETGGHKRGYPRQMKHAGIPVLTEQFETDKEMEQLVRVVKLWPGQGPEGLPSAGRGHPPRVEGLRDPGPHRALRAGGGGGAAGQGYENLAGKVDIVIVNLLPPLL